MTWLTLTLSVLALLIGASVGLLALLDWATVPPRRPGLCARRAA